MLSSDGAADGGGRMTRAEIVKKLRDTSEIMAKSAASLHFYGVASARAVRHAEELAGAAEMVKEWADELEKEEAK